MNQIDEQVDFDCFLGIIYDVSIPFGYNTIKYMFDSVVTETVKTQTSNTLKESNE